MNQDSRRQDARSKMREEGEGEAEMDDGRDAGAELNEHMQGLLLFICMQADTAGTVEALEDYALRDLLGWLKDEAVMNGLAGQVLGLCLVEAAYRFERGAA